jgi:hypothetical protein
MTPSKLAAAARYPRTRAPASGEWATPAAVATLLALALVLGGGGADYPSPRIALHGAAAATAALWLWRTRLHALGLASREVALLALILIAIPAVQLVPLPSALWQALPGRELEQRALALAGAPDSWRPWTISPSRTFAALLASVPPILLLILASLLPARQRWIVPAVIALIGLISLAIGALQMLSPLDGPLRFYAPKSQWLHGFEFNHNSQADFLLVGVVALAATMREAIERGRIGRGPALAAGALGAALLSLGVVLTASRTGIVLLPLALGLGSALLWRHLWSVHLAHRRLLPAIACLACAFMAGAVILTPVAQAFARFDFSGEPRPAIWRDSLLAAAHYWPFGSGAGTFVPAYAQFESPQSLGPFPIEHAHNEVLELLIEAGAFAAVAGAAVALIVLRAARRILTTADRPLRNSVQFGGAAIWIVALHSLVDYPLRSLSLACMVGACAGLAFMPKEQGGRLVRREEEAR